jgi:2-alkenal reductase
LNAGGDLVVEIDGHPVRYFGELISYLVSQVRVGQTITLTLLRDGERLEIPVVVTARP